MGSTMLWSKHASGANINRRDRAKRVTVRAKNCARHPSIFQVFGCEAFRVDAATKLAVFSFKT